MSRTLHVPPNGESTTEANRPTLKMSLSVELPRVRASVPLVRHLTAHSLRELGVTEDVLDDVLIALSEVCTNVIDHAEVGDSYKVAVFVQGQECEVWVIDSGRGFNAMASTGHARAEFERGRGLAIVRALMDRVGLESQADHGTLVTLEKHLRFQPRFGDP
jgi:serine/threonine-protein kinase RsbW